MERTAKEALTYLLANMDSSNADVIVEAIEALIYEKLEETMNLMADRIQDATGVRP